MHAPIFENSIWNLTSSIRKEGRELRDVLMLVSGICCTALEMWCNMRADVRSEGCKMLPLLMFLLLCD